MAVFQIYWFAMSMHKMFIPATHPTSNPLFFRKHCTYLCNQYFISFCFSNVNETFNKSETSFYELQYIYVTYNRQCIARIHYV